MTDYWKSTAKHYCKFCSCWLAGNKASIELHESGNHHKSMVSSRLDQVRKAGLEKEREDKKMNQTLGEIERAAQESFRKDAVADATKRLSTEVTLPSKLKRPSPNQPVQVQLKKPKFIIKTPAPKPVFEPLDQPSESETKTEEKDTKTETTQPEGGTWYESKNEAQESFYWNDTTGESTWTTPAAYLSIEEQRAKGLKV